MYFFYQENTVFMGFKVGKDGAHVDLEKIKVIQEWSATKNVGEV